MTPRIFFRHVQMMTQSMSDYWYFTELEAFVNYMDIQYDNETLLDIWYIWDREDKRYLTLDDFCEVVGIPSDFVPETKV